MGWVRLSDDFYDHRKFQSLTGLAIAAWVTGLAYCNRNLTDGHIPRRAAMRIVNTDDAYDQHGEPVYWVAVVDELVSAGLWVEDGDGDYRVHDYLSYQWSAEKIKTERAKTTERVKTWRNGQRNAVTNAVTNADVTPPVTGGVTHTPNPTPKPKEQSQNHPSRKRADASDDPSFDAFWAVYPKRADKGAAKTAWKGALRKATADVIIAGAERYRDDPLRKQEFTKNPATWLRAESWDNQPGLAIVPRPETPEEKWRRLNPWASA